MSEALRLESIRVGYGRRIVVDGLSLALQSGEIGCLLGESGCGKTTALRAIAGFEPVRGGRIALHGADIAPLPPERRRVGLMFQDYALFPHLSVRDNVGFGLARLQRAGRAARVAEMLALIGLQDRAQAYPHELSGGQQQRVALARALAPAPALLLLDEPFSSLDADMRQRLAGELRALLKATHTTALMVTHDQGEAFATADRIGVMADGRLLQWADAETLYCRPVDRQVAGFIGRGGWVSGAALGLAADVDVRVRPDQLVVDDAGAIRATLDSVTFRGPHTAGVVRFETGETAEIDLPARLARKTGGILSLRLEQDGLLVFPR